VSLNYVLGLVLQHLGRGHVLDGLVRELEVLLERDGVLDLQEDDGGGEEESGAEKTPLPGTMLARQIPKHPLGS